MMSEMVDAANALGLNIKEAAKNLKDALDGISEQISDFGTEPDGEFENIVSKLDHLVNGVHSLANSITPQGSVDGRDATGGTVGSLTEAVMGVTAAGVQIADAINNIADAIRDKSVLTIHLVTEE
jgi:tetrahydromethanopterin S-methyltransferase subunit B